MNPQEMSVAQLKQALGQRRLKTSGRKNELIVRLQDADPTGTWAQEEMVVGNEDVESEEEIAGEQGEESVGGQEEAVSERNLNTHVHERDLHHREVRFANERHERDLNFREVQLANRERELMSREIEILRRENELLRRSPASNASMDSRTTIDIRNVGKLLGDFDGSGEDFQLWRAQVNLLRKTYELTESAAKLMVGSKLQGNAQRWYRSRAEYLSMSLDDLLREMENVFDQPLGRLELRRKFEARKWKIGEPFHEYWHDKIILGNRISIQEDELIEYMVDGIPSDTMRNQARMQSFLNVQEVLRAFKKILLTPGVARQGFSTSPRRAAPREVGVSHSHSVVDARQAVSSEKTVTRGAVRCYACNAMGHYSKDCPTREQKVDEKVNKSRKNQTEKTVKQQVGVIREEQEREPECSAGEDFNDDEGHPEEDETSCMLNLEQYHRDEYQLPICCDIKGTDSFSCMSQIDTGCPISIIKKQLVDGKILEKPGREWKKYYGINQSRLEVLGVVRINVTLEGVTKPVIFGVVDNNTMFSHVLLGRDSLKQYGYRLTKNLKYDEAVKQILGIDIGIDINCKTQVDQIYINPEISLDDRLIFKNIFIESYCLPQRPTEPKIKGEAIINLKNNQLVQFGPRRLSFADKIKVQEMLDNLLSRGIIQRSKSEYSSPIVLTRKKNGEIRMCVDYRALNKIIARDNYPLPLIEDQLDTLRGKRFFSTLDLKDGFYNVRMSLDSAKYTSFVTPMRQFEYVRMPFGLKIGPQCFQRFINDVLSEFLKDGTAVVYMDDILVASKDLVSHLNTLRKIFNVLVENNLELRLDKCSFLCTEIKYLGYKINSDGLRPNDRGVTVVQDFPEPKTIKEVHSFLGLASYFRKFIIGFSIVAKPLYSLLKKNINFTFGEIERTAFRRLKQMLIEAPTLSIYDPKAYTELHCDASSHGFGAVLMQRQCDQQMHPIFYFSKRTTEAEAKYHSFELETLAIVYALRRFRIYLQGISFVIISDCSAVTQTLEKRDINNRIARWSLELQHFDYKVIHRAGTRMSHVDALSRSFGILVVEDNPFEWNLVISQNRDPAIKKIITKLEMSQDPNYELRDGLVYKKHGSKLLFLVPTKMENYVLFHYHNEMGHLGVKKMIELIKNSYWFPLIREKCDFHIRNCLKCIAFAPKSGKPEGTLHSIPKGQIPFETLHIDHLGPMDNQITVKKYILLIVDAFSKFVRLFATKTTNTKEVIKCLDQYFQSYSTPKIIISDRGSAFTSAEFDDFVKKRDIKHVKVATGSPQANGQAERLNRTVLPMLSKLSDKASGKNWYSVLTEVEYVLNNSINRATGRTPSQLIFGFEQRGPCIDKLKEFISIANNPSVQDIQSLRTQAAEKTAKLQQYQEKVFNSKHKASRIYKIGELVMIRNYETTPGVSKKLLPKFRGPYEIKQTLGNDRYIVRDLPGFQNTNKTYEGIWEAKNIRPWLKLFPDCV